MTIQDAIYPLLLIVHSQQRQKIAEQFLFDQSGQDFANLLWLGNSTTCAHLYKPRATTTINMMMYFAAGSAFGPMTSMPNICRGGPPIVCDGL